MIEPGLTNVTRESSAAEPVYHFGTNPCGRAWIERNLNTLLVGNRSAIVDAMEQMDAQERSE